MLLHGGVAVPRFLLDELGDDSPHASTKVLHLQCPWPYLRLALGGLPAPLLSAIEMWIHDAVRHSPTLMYAAERIRRTVLPPAYLAIHLRQTDFISNGRPQLTAQQLAWWVEGVSAANSSVAHLSADGAVLQLDDLRHLPNLPLPPIDPSARTWSVYIATDDANSALIRDLQTLLRSRGHLPLLWSDLDGPLRASVAQWNGQSALSTLFYNLPEAGARIEMLLAASASHFADAAGSTYSQAILEMRIYQTQQRCEALTQLQRWDESFQRLMGAAYPPTANMPFITQPQQQQQQQGQEGTAAAQPAGSTAAPADTSGESGVPFLAEHAGWFSAPLSTPLLDLPAPLSPFAASYFTPIATAQFGAADAARRLAWTWPKGVAPPVHSPVAACPSYEQKPSQDDFKPPMPMTPLGERVLARFLTPFAQQVKLKLERA